MLFRSGRQSISVGVGNVVNGENSGAFGDPSIVNASNSYSVGNNNAIGGNGTDNAFAFGGQNNLGATATRDANGVIDNTQALTNVANVSKSAVVGFGNTVKSQRVMVLGNGVTVNENRDGSVVLGDGSNGTVDVKAVNSAKVNNITYSGFAGNLDGSSS